MNRTHLTKKAILLTDPVEQNLHDLNLLAGFILPVKSYLAWVKKAQTFLSLLMVLSLPIIFPGCLAEDPDDGGNPNGEKEITFIAEGDTFAPVIKVTGNPQIKWKWADGDSSISSSPIKIYGSRARRTNKLVVKPWSAVQRINIGYDGGDQGSDTIEHVKNQYVQSVSGLGLVAPYLKVWCSSFNLMESLDFSNFVKLEEIECYNSININHVKLSGTKALRRACFENNILADLDLSGCPNLEDLRAARNGFTDINFGTIGSKIWHICIRENTDLTNDTMFKDTQRFPKLSELFIWGDNQKGKLDLANKELSSILAWNNHYTTADFSGSTFSKAVPSSEKNINLNGNGLESLILTNCTGALSIEANNNHLSNVDISSIKTLKILDLNRNNLSEASVESILHTLDLSGIIGVRISDMSDCRVDLSGGNNAGLNANAQVYVANLKSKNWDVITGAPVSGEARIYFSTKGNVTTMNCSFSGNATATWHWSDGTQTQQTKSGEDVSKSWTDNDVHNNYLVIDHGSALTQFGASRNGGNTGMGHLTAISGLNNCLGLNILYAYNERALASIGDVDKTAITEYHLQNTNLSATAMDKIFADIVTTGISDGKMYCDNLGTSASNDNRATLNVRKWNFFLSVQ